MSLRHPASTSSFQKPEKHHAPELGLFLRAQCSPLSLSGNLESRHSPAGEGGETRTQNPLAVLAEARSLILLSYFGIICSLKRGALSAGASAGKASQCLPLCGPDTKGTKPPWRLPRSQKPQGSLRTWEVWKRRSGRRGHKGKEGEELADALGSPLSLPGVLPVISRRHEIPRGQN